MIRLWMQNLRNYNRFFCFFFAHQRLLGGPRTNGPGRGVQYRILDPFPSLWIMLTIVYRDFTNEFFKFKIDHQSSHLQIESRTSKLGTQSRHRGPLLLITRFGSMDVCPPRHYSIILISTSIQYVCVLSYG